MTLCAWCGETLSRPFRWVAQAAPTQRVSHGMCGSCLRAQLTGAPTQEAQARAAAPA